MSGFISCHTLPTTEAVVGLEQNLYETSEDDVILEICAAVMDPVTLTPLSAAELNPVFVAEFDFFLEPVSAIGTHHTRF